jgi:hypothetical protein
MKIVEKFVVLAVLLLFALAKNFRSGLLLCVMAARLRKEILAIWCAMVYINKITLMNTSKLLF